jgi:hypothetical protein
MDARDGQEGATMLARPRLTTAGTINAGTMMIRVEVMIGEVGSGEGPGHVIALGLRGLIRTLLLVHRRKTMKNITGDAIDHRATTAATHRKIRTKRAGDVRADEMLTWVKIDMVALDRRAVIALPSVRARDMRGILEMDSSSLPLASRLFLSSSSPVCKLAKPI